MPMPILAPWLKEFGDEDGEDVGLGPKTAVVDGTRCGDDVVRDVEAEVPPLSAAVVVVLLLDTVVDAAKVTGIPLVKTKMKSPPLTPVPSLLASVSPTRLSMK